VEVQVQGDGRWRELGEALALVDDQMHDLTALQQTRATLVVAAAEADGTVEVSVDAQRLVTKVVIDESYLDEHEFSELGAHLTRAAQAAFHQVDEHAEDFIVAMRRRREAVSAMYEAVVGSSDLPDRLAELGSPAGQAGAVRSGDHDGDGWEHGSALPTVRT
jgi:DNA-binding protein YbaB